MELSDFDYSLSDELIAQRPAIPRDHSRLLIVRKGLQDDHFYNILSYLKKGDVLVLNDTKVLKAKLVGKKSTGSPAEIILTKHIKGPYWHARIKTRSPKKGQVIILRGGRVDIIKSISIDEFLIRLNSKKILNSAVLPNPPYIKNGVRSSEYQTVYSWRRGSLAAPTAGLHFTKRLLEKIKKKGVKIAYVTLHIGYGTFLPVAQDIKNHKTEPENYEISGKCAKAINERKGRLMVVGTTTLKALESSSQDRKVIPGMGVSGIFIYPGHKFRSGADILITNMHLPKSSLIILTCAFGNTKRIMDAYKHAVSRKYRFYSLGDAMMVFKANINGI
jgi:S-adenosylmethionine:tRNA ribosyltransferase-isomerase